MLWATFYKTAFSRPFPVPVKCNLFWSVKFCENISALIFRSMILKIYFWNGPFYASFLFILGFYKQRLLFLQHNKCGNIYQTNITIFTTNWCDKMSFQFMVLVLEPTTLRTWVSSHNHKARYFLPEDCLLYLTTVMFFWNILKDLY